MKTLEQITLLTKELRMERDTLAHRVKVLNSRIADVQSDLMPGIRNKVNCTAAQYSLLYSAIDESRSLFDSPKSIVVHGYRIGLRKGNGGISCADPERTIELIEKHLSGQFDDLVKTKYSPDLDAISDLSGDQIRKIGCTVEDTGDVVFIKPTDSAVDKIVKALLKSATDQVAEKQAA